MNRWLLTLTALLMALPAQADLSDPTRPLSYSAGTSAETLSLTSIFRRGDRDTAIINGKLLTVGQRAGGIELVSVTESSATVRTADGLRTLTMHRDIRR